MDLLTLQHQDFHLRVRSSNVRKAFEKARTHQRDFFSATTYNASSGDLALIDKRLALLEPLLSVRAHPIFFENKDYHFGISFLETEPITDVYIHSRSRDLQEKFFFDSKLGYISGTINFANDIGKCDLIIRYTKGGRPCQCSLGFEVFPTKLDYRNNYQEIIADIEEQYPYLVLDFLKKTYSAFQSGTSANTDLIWWEVFGGLYKDFLKASKFVLGRPHSRIVRTSRHVRADRIVRWNRTLEERFAEFGLMPQTLYYEEHKSLSTDTPENQFFKHALRQTARRFKKVKTYIVKTFSNRVSESFASELSTLEKDIDALSNNPFLKPISSFRGLRQESLVLQKASGYSTVYKSWIMLNAGLRFLDGIQRIELKNIAELYQIWCFLTIKGMLQQLIGKAPDDVKLAEIQVDDFVFKIVRGVHSKVTFRQPNGNLVDLFHDLSYERARGEDGLRSFTVEQRPDIVLRITKTDLRDEYVLTYLYDAKYRLKSDEREDAPDVPEEDSINQMHRYRDAIYYVDKRENRPQKEVLGAYVLFPGGGDIEHIRESEYLRSIADVNIGAFPLVPGDQDTRIFLSEHLQEILGLTTENALKDVAPQKQSPYESLNPEVLIGIVPDEKHASCFKREKDRFYYTGAQKPNHFGYKNLRYFAPYISGHGIKEYYEILGYEIIRRDEIVDAPPPRNASDSKSERLVLRLGECHRIPSDQDFCKLSDKTIWHFRYTNLFNLRNPRDGKIDAFVVSR